MTRGYAGLGRRGKRGVMGNENFGSDDDDEEDAEALADEAKSTRAGFLLRRRLEDLKIRERNAEETKRRLEQKRETDRLRRLRKQVHPSCGREIYIFIYGREDGVGGSYGRLRGVAGGWGGVRWGEVGRGGVR